MTQTAYVSTKLEKEHIKNLLLISETHNLRRMDILIDALREFESQLSKNKSFQPIFTQFDRAHVTVYNIYIRDNLIQQINQLAKNLGITKFQLLREILLNYLAERNKRKK